VIERRPMVSARRSMETRTRVAVSFAVLNAAFDGSSVASFNSSARLSWARSSCANFSRSCPATRK